MSDAPRRIQRQRTKGWRKPPGCVCVTRPGMWSNPYPIERDRSGWWCMLDHANGLLFKTREAALRQSLVLFREAIDRDNLAPLIRAELRGKSLACWCELPAPGEPDLCHAAVLMELANALPPA